MVMSNLQLGLAIAGGLVLAGVVAHGAWTSRKNAPLQAQPEDDPAGPKNGAGGVDFDAQHPTSAGGAGPDRHASHPGGVGAIDPVFDAGLEPSFGTSSFARVAILKKPMLDVLIDVIAPIALDAPVSGDAALAAMPTTRRVGSKPFGIEGFNAASQQWELPAAGQRYSALQAGVQLANRSGALNDIEYSEFVIKTQAFADAVNGAPDFPEMRDEVARARELDSFAGGHDGQLSFTLRARHAAWSPGFVAQHASRLGFVAGAMPGRMVLPASTPGMPPVLGLGFDAQAAMAEDPAQSAIREITLSLDVPQVERAERPFVRMRESANALSLAMDGVVTDDNGAVLPSDAMDVIGSELEQLYDTLDARDLSAGSILARRLFS
jgi:ZipA, C-terminal FtsZ-binding domain